MMKKPSAAWSAVASACRVLSSNNRIPSAIAVLIGIGVLVSLGPLVFVSTERKLLRQAAVSLSREEYQEAERLAHVVLERSPQSSAALLIAARTAAQRKEPREALSYYKQVADDGSRESLEALYGCADRLLLLGRVAEAEHYLRRVLAQHPQHRAANEKLVHLLGSQGRSWEALPNIFELIRLNHFGKAHLVMAGSTEWMFFGDSNLVETSLKAVPNDPLPLLGRARTDLHFDRIPQAREILSRIVASESEQAEAQARWGRLLLDSASNAEFLQWQRELPQAVDRHPEIWFVRGLWARRNRQPRAAVRCFGEAVVRDANHRGANYQLSQLLVNLGESEAARPFAERANSLAKLESRIAEARADNSAAMFRELAELTEALGRSWEAAAWSHLAWLRDAQANESRSSLKRLRRQVVLDTVLTPPSASPAWQLDFSNYPLPTWSVEDPGQPASPAEPAAEGIVKFVDSAAETGLHFRYYNGADPQSGRAYMFEFSGGGVAVLDYDGDGWPDIYLTQGCPWPVQAGQRQYRNRLFRNRGDGRFDEVTASCGAADGGFGQGVTVGDFNNDGFPDVYVANIGGNRLYENNGDGTFTDVTALSGTAGSQWTTSCLLADLNGNGLPDIYAVNYLAGDVFERICTDGERPFQCAPTMFPAEQDRLYLNMGDGRFEDVTESSGVTAPDGKGLGILAADFDGSRRLSLFIANDTTANFYFVNQTRTRGERPTFVENAVLSGLAFDAEGRAQACMGIAADDADGSGRLALFVTNFYFESNTLYRQQPDQTFLDASRQWNLRDLGFASLGFGTQFIDAELNGRPDLIVTNGHINDLSSDGTPYQMPPQYFRNVGSRFVEVPGETLGAYFQQKYLGRALARLDWNRDGREDVCITHVDAPVALLTNQTPNTGHYLSLNLRGVTSDRDAIGTIVRVTADGRSRMRQLTAGDGFEVSNQRQLVFGLGEARRIDELTVTWPTGLRQVFRDLPVDRELTLIEGQSEPTWIFTANHLADDAIGEHDVSSDGDHPAFAPLQ